MPLFTGRIDLRFSTSRDMRDARLIRAELKLDRLLDLSQEISERPKERVKEERELALKPIEKLPDSLKGHINEKEHISEELDQRLEELRVQVKLSRLFARIEDDLRELRRNLTTAQFASEGEEGFIPQEVLNSDSENEARLKAARFLDIIEEGLDYFETDRHGTADFDLSFSRCIDLESLQEEVREAASKSRDASLGEIRDSLLWIEERVGNIRAYERLEKRAEQGDASAQYELGIAYRDGRRGVQDYEEAYYWLYLAVTANFATQNVGTDAVIVARDDAASHLTPSGLSRVQGRARKWIGDHFADLAQYPLARRAAEEILAGWEEEDAEDGTTQ